MSKRPEYFGTKGCLIQLGRSRNNHRSMRQIRDMIMMVKDLSSEKFDDKIDYLRKNIEEALKNNKIDSFESMWLTRLLESEEINWILEHSKYNSNILDAANVYKKVA